MIETLQFFIKNPWYFVFFAMGSIVFYFVFGKADSKGNSSNGEGETYLSPEEQMERAIAIAEKSKKRVEAKKKKDGFDIVYDEPNGEHTAISVRKDKSKS